MAGPTTKAVYVSDDTTSYAIRLPAWEAALQTVSAVTTEPPLPKGYRRRKRFYRVTSTGKEGSITVCSASDALYTSAMGTAVSIPVLGSGTAAASTLQGRTGERDKNI
jgi:hypothetical protein